jgi:hypothetical protein
LNRNHCPKSPGIRIYVRNDNRAARLVKLIATCGPLDIDDPRPVITVMTSADE